MVLRRPFPPQSVGYRRVRRTVNDPNWLVRWKAGEPLAKVRINDYPNSIWCDTSHVLRSNENKLSDR